MSDTPPHSASQTRAVGLKLIIVGGLALLMWMPALFIYVLSFERSGRAAAVKHEIYQREGGEQRLAGPFLMIPAIKRETSFRHARSETAEDKAVRYTYIVLPRSLDAEGTLTSDQRRRSIFSATVYEADLSLTGSFDLSGLADLPNTEFLWEEARFGMGLGSPGALNGMRRAPSLTFAGQPVEKSFEPGLRSNGSAPVYTAATGLTVPVPLKPGSAPLPFALDMTMSGGGSFGLAALGDETTVTLKSDWPHPGFGGQLSPLKREISSEGFSASWAATALSRPLPRSFVAEGDLGAQLLQQVLTVDLVTPGSPYAKINRALKYALLFMGLIFLTVFILEIVFKSRAHPAQYILIGMAQVLFFLMVLALAEHIPFGLAFFIMSAATIALSGVYAASIFRRRDGGVIAAGAFTGVYTLIWLLMKSEDFGLLIGSSCAFTALAITMYVTRNVDWYGSTRRPPTAPGSAT